LDEEKEVVENKIDSLRARFILRVSPDPIPVIKIMQQHKLFGCVTVTKDTSKRSPKFATAQEAEFILDHVFLAGWVGKSGGYCTYERGAPNTRSQL
jgi:hypothetical protein